MSWENRLSVNGSPIRAVVGIIQNADKILITERPKNKSYAGFWEFPGGKIEAGESSFAALKRELHEEIGIDVLTADLWFQHQHTYPEKTVCLDIWRITEYLGTPFSKEDQQLHWVTAQEFKQHQILEGNYVILERLEELFS